MTVSNDTPPVLSGTTRQGQYLTSDQGAWTTDDPPLAYTYRWLRCDAAGANCVAIANEVNVQYLLRSADIGSTIRSEVTATEFDFPPPPPPGSSLTGVHWASPSEYDTLASIGFEFSIINVAPGDIAGAAAALDAAAAAGIQLIIGLYDFGGPAPYSLSGDTWTLSSAATATINYFETRSADILAFFGFNEPLWVNQISGQTTSCGAHSANSLRDFRNKIQAVWPGALIYHDLGHVEGWAQGYLRQSHPCIGTKYDDMTDVADYVGIWDYPFVYPNGYLKSQALARMNLDAGFVVNNMGAVPVMLGQSFGDSANRYPSTSEIANWNAEMRAALPAGSLISWYVWRQSPLYDDYLANHPEQWSSVI